MLTSAFNPIGHRSDADMGAHSDANIGSVPIPTSEFILMLTSELIPIVHHSPFRCRHWLHSDCLGYSIVALHKIDKSPDAKCQDRNTSSQLQQKLGSGGTLDKLRRHNRNVSIGILQLGYNKSQIGLLYILGQSTLSLTF